jgi:hypothetical protein
MSAIQDFSNENMVFFLIFKVIICCDDQNEIDDEFENALEDPEINFLQGEEYDVIQLYKLCQ